MEDSYIEPTTKLQKCIYIIRDTYLNAHKVTPYVDYYDSHFITKNFNLSHVVKLFFEAATIRLYIVYFFCDLVCYYLCATFFSGKVSPESTINNEFIIYTGIKMITHDLVQGVNGMVFKHVGHRRFWYILILRMRFIYSIYSIR